MLGSPILGNPLLAGSGSSRILLVSMDVNVQKLTQAKNLQTAQLDQVFWFRVEGYP